MLFDDAWSQKGHSASNTTVILTSSYLLRLDLEVGHFKKSLAWWIPGG